LDKRNFNRLAQGEVDIIFSSIEVVTNTAIDYRTQLGRQVQELLSEAELMRFQDKLARNVDGAVNSIGDNITAAKGGPFRSGSQTAKAVVHRAEQKAASIKVRIASRIAALPLEIGFKMHAGREAQLTTFNFSNNTVANLNLGSVIGDLNGTIQQMEETGQEGLAEAITELTAAVGASNELKEGAKKELLEHLSVVSEEAVKAPEKRKMGPLKTSIEAIKSAILVGTQLLSLWNGVEHELQAHDIIPK
jgi:hypothetical protein